ncbi:MAG: exodeoxyribonuclease V subunit RecC [Candidatus Westeberhardia cardiocondylae]|nr:exodeoxyribonuclease V subunit RecC [Candidatus Westeberhardia cardiocondylae]
MLFIYRSNDFDIHRDILVKNMRNSCVENPLHAEVILVENQKMENWIQLELSLHLGIASNIEYFSVSDFIWMFSSYISSDSLISKRFFLNSVIAWKIMRILPVLCKIKGFDMLCRYFYVDQDICKNFCFSYEVAVLFHRYMMFRPNWLVAWERKEFLGEVRGVDQVWQSLLWYELINDMKRLGEPFWHLASFYGVFSAFLKKKYINLSKVPKRIFVFGVPLSKLMLLYLREISYYVDVYLFFMDLDCFCSWKDLEKYLDDVNCEVYEDNLYKSVRKKFYFSYGLRNKSCYSNYRVMLKNVRNLDLFVWDKVRKNIFYLLITTLRHYHNVDMFRVIRRSSGNLLSMMQYDVLVGLCNGVTESSTLLNVRDDRLYRNIIFLKDVSFSVHVCCSLHREVEVLYDFLVDLMVKDSTLNPRDIIVMAPDIDIYIEIIKSVFSSFDGKKCSVPFSISDQVVGEVHAVFTVFLKLLELPYSKCCVEDIFDFLGVSFIASRFSISVSDLDFLYRWVVNSGIRFGLDKNTYYELMYPIFERGTWKYGLDRMFLGYAVGDIQYDSWQDMYPHSEYYGGNSVLIGYLSNFIDKLDYWKEYLSVSRVLLDWESCVSDMIGDFFSFSDSGVEEYCLLLKKYWHNILHDGLLAKYDGVVPIALLCSELKSRLNKRRIYNKFLSGGINFCSLFSMCFLSFKVVCFLGMDGNLYPRKSFVFSFDLMRDNNGNCDISLRDYDLYVFWSFVLCARDIVYISYVFDGDVSNLFDSMPCFLNNIVRYISRNFCLFGDEFLCEKISMLRVKRHVCCFHGFFSSCLVQKRDFFLDSMENTNSIYLEKNVVENNICCERSFHFFNVFCSDFVVSMDWFLSFYCHPIRFWFQKRLCVYYSSFLKLYLYEPFSVDYITRYKLNMLLLSAFLQGKSSDSVFRFANGIGVLPCNAFAEVYWNDQCIKMYILYKKIKKYYLSDFRNVKFSLKLCSIKIHGVLSCVQKDGLLRWKAGNLLMRDIMLFWLEHLIYCSIGGEGSSVIVGLDTSWIFGALSIVEAKELLLLFLYGYARGMLDPLYLIYSLGGSWLFSCYDKKNRKIDFCEEKQKKARDSMLFAWCSDVNDVEKRDIYIYRMIRRLDNEYINIIIEETVRYMLPLLVFRE